MYEFIRKNKCFGKSFENLLSHFGDDKDKERNFTIFLVAVIVLFVIYYYHDTVQKYLRKFCNFSSNTITKIHDVEESIFGFSTTSPVSASKNLVF